MNVEVYPSGFRVERPGLNESRMVYDGHSNVIALYEEYVSGHSDINTFEFLTKTLTVAKEVFNGNVVRFIAMNLRVKSSSDSHKECLLDLIRHVNGDTRKVTTINWKPLLADPTLNDAWDVLMESRRETTPHIDFSAIPKELLKLSNDDFLAKWVSRGIEDIVCTLYVLFGK
jgi:hypothetical protein